GGEGVVDAHGDVLPHHVILGHAGFQAARRVPRDDQIKRQRGQGGHGEPPALGQHDGADSEDAEHFRGDLARHGRHDGRDLVGLIDAPGESPAGTTVEEGERQTQYVAEGGLDQVRLDRAGHRGTLQVGGQGEEVADHADDEEQRDGPQQGGQGLLASARRDVVGAMRQLGFLKALQLLIAYVRWQRLAGDNRGAGFLRDAIHEQSSDVVDGCPVNQRLEKVGADSQEGQEGDEDETSPVGPRQLEQNLPCAQIVRGAFWSHAYRQMVAGGARPRRCPLFCNDRSLPRAQAIAGGGDLDASRLAAFAAHDEEREAVERLAVVGLEALDGSRVAVVDAGDFGGTVEGEFHQVVGGGAEVAVLILDTYGDEREVVA